MKTNLKIAAVALAALVAGNGLALAGNPWDVISGGISNQNAPSNPISDAINNANNNDPDFDGIFNPQPQQPAPVIHKVIDITTDKPTIYKVLDLFPDGQPTTGGYLTYRQVALANPGLKLSCSVAGTPVEFPDDIFIANTGTVAVPAGTKIRWHVASLGLDGVATLDRTLKTGKSIGLRGVLEGGAEIGTPCAIKAIGH
jgi:hypothetical protein